MHQKQPPAKVAISVRAPGAAAFSDGCAAIGVMIIHNPITHPTAF
ncbi:MAG: hypothetical protein MPW15_16545 [Candidatus Manganitrophus sp.]|nr:hypothetical protein [Candidatus Manganitrophus sp.]